MNRPCMLCGEPLNANDECSTPFCAYNPETENQKHEREEKLGEHQHTGGTCPTRSTRAASSSPTRRWTSCSTTRRICPTLRT